MRLPRELSFKEKLAKVEEIIETLHLQDCANTCKASHTANVCMIFSECTHHMTHHMTQ